MQPKRRIPDLDVPLFRRIARISVWSCYQRSGSPVGSPVTSMSSQLAARGRSQPLAARLDFCHGLLERMVTAIDVVAADDVLDQAGSAGVAAKHPSGTKPGICGGGTTSRLRRLDAGGPRSLGRPDRSALFGEACRSRASGLNRCGPVGTSASTNQR